MDLFTIGHSNYEVNYFINIVKKYKINCIVDVRSIPYSKYSPQYNKENIKKLLKINKINYIYMGKEFGAMRTAKTLYTKEGYVDFEKVKYDKDFKLGINRVKVGVEKGYNIAFMCSEKNPTDCHRCILIGRTFKELGYNIINIIDENKYKLQNDIEKELIETYYPDRNQISLIPEMNLSNEELINNVYKFKNREIGYRLSSK